MLRFHLYLRILKVAEGSRSGHRIWFINYNNIQKDTHDLLEDRSGVVARSLVRAL